MSKLTLVASQSQPDHQMFAEAFEQLDTGLCLIDDAGAVRSCNAAFRDLLGLPANWANGKRSKCKTVSAAEDLIAGWLSRLNADGDFSETVALSPQNSVAVDGKTLPSGGIRLSVRPAGDPDVSLLRDSLQQSEARLRAIVDHSPMHVLVKNIEGRFEFVGKGFSDAYELTQEEVIGKTAYDLMPKAFADVAVAQDRRVIVTGRPIREHMEAVFADGSHRRLLVTKFPIRNGAGEMVGIGAINVDVSDQLATPAELVDRDTLLRSIVDNAESLFALKDLEGRFQIVSKKFEEWYGIAEEDAVGKTVHELFSAEYANVELMDVQDRRVCESGKEIREEVTITFADGNVHSILASKFPVRSASGEIVGVGIVSTDITDRVNDRRALTESETRFRSLLDHLPSLISLKDAAGKFILVNPAWERSFGQSAPDMMGQTIWDAVPGVDWSDSDASDARLLAGECDVIEDEVTIVTADGRRRMLQRIKFPVFDANQQPAGVGTVSNDVTALMEGREELRRSEAALRYGEKLARMGNWDRNFATGDVFWSDQVFEILGIEKQPVPSLEQVLDFVHPDDRHKLRDKLEKMFAGVATHDVEFRVVTSDGEIRHVYERSETEFDGEGRPTRCVGVLQDITAARLADNALRESEQRFRSLIDHLPSAISLKDAEHRFVLVNKSFESRFNTKESEIIGQPVHSALRGHIDWQATLDAEQAILDGSQEFSSEVVSLRFDGGTERTFEVRKFPVTDSAGQITGVGTISSDVTESMRANEALRRSEASLANAQRIAHLGNWDWDITHNTLHWSDEIYNIFGLAKDEFGASYDAFLNSVHPDDRDFVTESVDAALNDGETYSIDHRIVLPDGAIRTVHETGEVSFDGNGRPTQMTGTVQDVTEQREAECSLRESEEWLRAITDNTPSAIFVKDLDGRHIFANRQWHDVHNPQDEDLYGTTAQDLLAPDLHDLAQRVDRQVLETGEPVFSEFKMQNAAGDWRDILQVKFPVRDANGDIIALGGSNTDVTERVAAQRALRESEERLRAIADNAPSAIYLKDAAGRYIFANRVWHQMYNAQGGDIVGKTVEDFFPPDVVKAAKGTDRQVVETGEPIVKEQYLPTHNGENRMVLQVKFPVRDESDEVVAIGAVNTDITERVATERALRESEERFRALVDNLPASLSLKDAEHGILFVNKQMTQWYGIPASEFIGKRFDDVFPDREVDKFTAVQDSVLETGKPQEREFRTKFANGERRDLHSIIFPVFTGDGQNAQVGTLSFDITDRKAADRARRETEERFRALVDHLPASLSLKDADHKVLFVNKQLTEWHGIPAVDFIGKRFGEVLASKDNADPEFLAAQDLVLESQQPLEREIRAEFADGNLHDLQTIMFPVLTGDGQNTQVGTLSFDITDRKTAELARRESEERFRAFVDHVPAGVTLKGPDGNAIFVNEQIEQWYGISAESIVGKKFHDVMDSSQKNTFGHERIVEAQNTIRETGKAVQIEFPLTFADGTPHELRTVIFPIETADDRGPNMGAIYFDVTEIKKTEEMLRQAQKMQAVGQLTGGVAHDFNNLLAVVIGNLELIADHFVAHLQQDAPVFGHVRKAFAAAERGASLTHHLLAFSRQQVLQPEETDLADLVAETNELMAVSMGERIAVTLHTDSDPWRSRIDRVQLQNAILNLAINARDAMAGSGEITIAVANVRVEDTRAVALEMSAGDYVCVSISDTGPGIPADVLEHVFEPFFTTKDVGKGSGLGLSMVYGFVRQSGGGIDIDTEVGVGTTVHMYFPAVMPSPFAALEDFAAGPEDLAAPDATILLVEDNPMFREVTRAILEGLNFQVYDFGTAEEALELIGSSAKFDLLLSDIGLPGDMDGHALAQHAASARPGLKIVLMSAHTDRGLNGGIVDHNVSAFLRKPHRKAELNQVLRRLLALEAR